ncbi:MAG: hypothetical protein ACERKV_01630 [Clostridiaceae bacterium]
MEFYEFVIGLVDALVWPVFITIIVIIMKKQIRGLISGVKKFKYGHLEINFAEKMNKINKAIKKESGDKRQENDKDNDDDEDDIEIIATISPESAIILAWSEVEKEIKNVIMKRAISLNHLSYNSICENIDILKEENLIDEDVRIALNDMCDIRKNITEKYIGKNILVKQQALEFHETSKKIIDYFKNIK